MPTYNETILRFHIMRHDELPEGHKKALRDSGIDPDTRWSLIYSFDNDADALECINECNDEAADWETYKMVDGGESITIERSII